MGRRPKEETAETGNKKLDVIAKLVASMQVKHGKESINFLGNKTVEPIPRLSSGSSIIDEVTGGGYPLGRIIELYGAESSGKSTACYHAIAEAQRAYPDKICAYIDSEFSFDPNYAQKIGVNVGELLVSQPNSGEEAFGLCQSLLENDDVKISLIIVDSVAAMLPRVEADEDDYSKNQMGLQARMMSKALRKLTSVVGRSGAVIIFTNQTRSKIGVMYGSPECVTLDTMVEVVFD